MKLTKGKGILPVGIHALRIASLLCLLPNPVRIPTTAKSFFFFFSFVSLVSIRCFETYPSFLALFSSIWSTDNFFCCSLWIKTKPDFSSLEFFSVNDERFENARNTNLQSMILNVSSTDMADSPCRHKMKSKMSEEIRKSTTRSVM